MGSTPSVWDVAHTRTLVHVPLPTISVTKIASTAVRLHVCRDRVSPYRLVLGSISGIRLMLIACSCGIDGQWR